MKHYWRFSLILIPVLVMNACAAKPAATPAPTGALPNSLVTIEAAAEDSDLSQTLVLGQLAARLDEIDKTRPVAVICEHGNRSQAAAALLGQKGFGKVYNVLGGTNGWREAGLPVSRNGQQTKA